MLELKNKIQEEYNAFVELDSSCELTDDEINESFWSEEIIKYNDNHEGNEVGFTINNGIIEIIEY
jgi:hypothetical protein